MFVVIEMQKTGDEMATLTNAYKTKPEAESAYHTALAAAAISNVDIHSCVILTEEGYIDKSQSYKHKDD